MDGTKFWRFPEVEAAKPSYQTSARMLLDKVLPERVDDKGNTVFLAHQSLKIKKKVKEVMSPIHSLLEEGDSFNKAVYIMFKENIRPPWWSATAGSWG